MNNQGGLQPGDLCLVTGANPEAKAWTGRTVDEAKSELGELLDTFPTTKETEDV